MDLWLARKLRRGQHDRNSACFRKTYLVQHPCMFCKEATYEVMLSWAIKAF